MYGLRLTGLGSELLEMGLFLNFKKHGSIMSVKFLLQKWLFAYWPVNVGMYFCPPNWGSCSANWIGQIGRDQEEAGPC